MVISVLIVFIIIFIYLKYPQVFSFKSNYTSGRYIRLDREDGTDPISVGNFIVYDSDGTIITPNSLSVNPRATIGDGKNPKSISDPTDIVLIETSPGASGSIPYIEYDLGIVKKISRVLIINRKKYGQFMQKTVLRVLDDDRNQIFEKKISDLQEMYSINIT